VRYLRIALGALTRQIASVDVEYAATHPPPHDDYRRIAGTIFENAADDLTWEPDQEWGIDAGEHAIEASSLRPADWKPAFRIVDKPDGPGLRLVRLDPKDIIPPVEDTTPDPTERPFCKTTFMVEVFSRGPVPRESGTLVAALRAAGSEVAVEIICSDQEDLTNEEMREMLQVRNIDPEFFDEDEES
jgi:hypothetical protein